MLVDLKNPIQKKLSNRILWIQLAFLWKTFLAWSKQHWDLGIYLRAQLIYYTFSWKNLIFKTFQPFLQIEEVATIFAAEEIIRKGELAEYMFQNSAFRQDALNMESIKDKTEDWKKTRNEKYIREAGWHFKTLAVQEVGAYSKVFHGFWVFLTTQLYH